MTSIHQYCGVDGNQPHTINHTPTNTVRETNDTLVFPVHFFNELSDFKAVVHSLSDVFLSLIGETRIMLALKKGSSIGNNIVRNKQLSLPNSNIDSQRCYGRGCMQCPQVLDKDDLMINGKRLRIPQNLNCKSKHIIYLWVCKLCNEKEVYFGRTTQESHDRSSGHRGCFTSDKWEKSALSMHAIWMCIILTFHWTFFQLLCKAGVPTKIKT